VKAKCFKGSILLAVCGSLHVLAALYLSRFHQAGVESAFHLIVHHATKHIQDATTKRTIEIHALAPCHSFPGPSYLHTHR